MLKLVLTRPPKPKLGETSPIFPRQNRGRHDPRQAPQSACMHIEIMHYFLLDCHILPHLARPFWFGGMGSMVTHKMFRTSLLRDPCGPTE